MALLTLDKFRRDLWLYAAYAEKGQAVSGAKLEKSLLKSYADSLSVIASQAAQIAELRRNLNEAENHIGNNGYVEIELQQKIASQAAELERVKALVSELIYNKEDAVSFFISAIEIDSHSHFDGEEWARKARALVAAPSTVAAAEKGLEA